MRSRNRFAVALAAAALLAGCARPPQAVESVRPVRTIVARPGPASLGNVFAGEVRPRYQSDLGFRVAGKIAARLVNVGDAVRAGQVLARLDPVDLSLNQAASQAGVTAQEAQLALERADLERFRKLLPEGFVSRAEVDRQQAKVDAAAAQLEAVRAQARVSRNQTGYAELRADHDGTIAALDAEIGQVVAAGQPVLSLAWSGEMEIAADLPEQVVREVRPGQEVEVGLWTVDGRRYAGRVREIATAADAATRTYRVRVTVMPAPAEMRLGMTASVRIVRAGVPDMIHLPLAAIVEQGGVPGAWVLDGGAGVVHFRPLQPAAFSGDEVLVAAGIAPGDVVVTAGAKLLSEGQKVRPLEAAAAAAR